MGITGDRGVEGADAFRGVNHQQRDISAFEMLAGHDHRKFFRHQMGFAFAANPCGIDEAKTLIITLYDFVHRIARGTGDGRDNRT